MAGSEKVGKVRASRGRAELQTVLLTILFKCSGLQDADFEAKKVFLVGGLALSDSE